MAMNIGLSFLLSAYFTLMSEWQLKTIPSFKKKYNVL